MTVGTCTFREMTRSLDPKCPDFSRKVATFQVRHCPEYHSVVPESLNMFISIIHVPNASIESAGCGLQESKNKHFTCSLLRLFIFPNIFMGSTSVRKQMQAEQSGSYGMQDLRN